MLTDRYGLRLSTASPEARDAYVEGCDLLLRMYPGAAAAFERASAADPGFALAHAGRARALQLGGDIAGAQKAVAAARGSLAGGLPDRDASQVAVLDLLVGGKPAAALEALRRHVASWPRDALVVSLAAHQTGLIGISGSPTREQDQLDFLAALAPHYGDDWWFNSHYAFALSDLGHQSAARPRIESSMMEGQAGTPARTGRSARPGSSERVGHADQGYADPTGVGRVRAAATAWLARQPRHPRPGPPVTPAGRKQPA